MNIEELHTFIKLCEIKNFTKTADALCMSQPTVSLHIKNLEREFQTQLFQRSPKLLCITPTGEILLERARQMVQLYEQTSQELLDYHHTVQGHLKIGASFTIGEYILPPLLVKLKEQYPELSFQIIIGNTEEIVQCAKLFQVDIGLVEGKTNEKEIIVEPFKDDELVIVSAACHPLAAKKNVSIADLQNEDWITREIGSGTGEYLKQFLQANELKVKTLMSISSIQGIKETVMNNLGLSMLSKSVIERDLKTGEMHVIQLDAPPLLRTLSYIYAPSMKEKRNVNIFIEALRQLF
ncbi:MULTISPECIES: LysR family transcriptional regulator [Bacillales]|uniref:LysR family transcriptional regulator n=1 Tax=Lysinibacillus louembei TaxID=1470088 RepID=A0ABZ0S1L2_9BACI|nr:MULTISPECIES: LysR family transcriptional regulator [Bacillales]MCT6923739.1 LysR family transcriptional regulator [Metasolibacillus sp.]MCT6940028.1 LysR family transcriptional regulator [Metasolibacillus sp.]WPK13366.1 LysR family transcriptional regulator [Lysinibacillus louembei]